jgi:hypothetical protein
LRGGTARILYRTTARTLAMSNPYTPPQSDLGGDKRKSPTRAMHPALRILSALFGFAILLVAASAAADVLKSGQLDTPAFLGISGLFCGGIAFAFLGLTGRERLRR